jgi:hypothetical protein
VFVKVVFEIDHTIVHLHIAYGGDPFGEAAVYAVFFLHTIGNLKATVSCNGNIHEEYNKAGFDAYIKKPFDFDLLYHIVRKHIANPGSFSV